MLNKEEIEKAKEFINNIEQTIQENNMLFGEENITIKAGKTTVQNIATLLQYIEELEISNKELDRENNRLEKIEFERDKANKMIDEMAKEMYSNISMLEMAKIGQAIDYDPRKMFAGISDEEAIDCIKQYFEKKVEEK